jgi:hypothetical protein
MRFVVIICSITILSACKNAQPVDVRELVKNATVNNGQMVTVSGCYYKGEEITVLHSCKALKLEGSIWILQFSQIENTAKSFPGYDGQFRKLEKKASAKEEQLAIKLSKMKDGMSAKVIIRGEFRYSSVPQFGHDGAYKYELILHRVVSFSPR